jgi:hypothetical protein
MGGGGGETWFLNLREEYRLRMSETKVLSKIFERTRKGKEGKGGNCIIRRFVVFRPTPYHTLMF